MVNFTRAELLKLHKPNLLRLSQYLNIPISIRWSKERMIDTILASCIEQQQQLDPLNGLNPENFSVRLKRIYGLLPKEEGQNDS